MANESKQININYGFDEEHKMIVAIFSAQISELNMAPAECISMTKILLQLCKHVAPEAVAGFTWPGMDDPINLKTEVKPPAGVLAS